MLIGIQPRSPASPRVSDFSVTPGAAMGGAALERLQIHVFGDTRVESAR
jgi:hypothetical protein